jgi:hypothetical protein
MWSFRTASSRSRSVRRARTPGLAAKLTGWRIDIRSESEVRAELEPEPEPEVDGDRRRGRAPDRDRRR